MPLHDRTRRSLGEGLAHIIVAVKVPAGDGKKAVAVFDRSGIGAYACNGDPATDVKAVGWPGPHDPGQNAQGQTLHSLFFSNS